ncbi:hypothetical protein [Streptomyces sp. NPDC088785]|uniref:hypothetical protein n=1 Tax=Streptomyces sp. NPDC088785 TaxID=3365897 RepID=UPI0037FB71E4
MTQRNPIAHRRLVASGVLRRTPAAAAAAQRHRVALLHKQCAADYAATAHRRAQDHRDDAHLCAYAAEAVAGR